MKVSGRLYEGLFPGNLLVHWSQVSGIKLLKEKNFKKDIHGRIENSQKTWQIFGIVPYTRTAPLSWERATMGGWFLKENKRKTL